MSNWIYHFDRKTGEYLCRSECRLDPRLKKSRIPAYATINPPPNTGPNEIAVANHNGSGRFISWSIEEDYRNETWYMPDGTDIEFSVIGQVPTGDMSRTMPMAARVNKSREEKIKELNEACRDFILSGFISDALGSPHSYPCKGLDRRNLTGLTISSIASGIGLFKFWCEDSNGTWDRRGHTAEQIQQVQSDCEKHISAAQDKLKFITDNIDAIINNDAINDEQKEIDVLSINWD